MSQDRAKTKPVAPRPNLERRRAAFLRKRLSEPDRHRARDLFLAFMARIESDRRDTVVEAHCLRVAELTASAEGLRARLAKEEQTAPLKDIAALVNSVTRAESTAARAERSLFKIATAKSDATADDPYSQFLREQEEDEHRAAKPRPGESK